MKPPTSTHDLRFFDPRSDIDRGHNRLPHWQQEGGTCFVSFRLADSIPKARLREWGAERELWLTRNRPPWSADVERVYHEQFTARIDQWCDEGAGSCALRQTDVRAVVSGALAHFDGQRYWQHAWVVMPNHVHSLFSPCAGHALPDVVKSWKGFAARAIHRETGKAGEFWMRDYFDRLVRDSAHFWRCARYIRRNPSKARLASNEFTLFEAPFVKEQLDAESLLNGAAAFQPPETRPENTGDGKVGPS